MNVLKGKLKIALRYATKAILLSTMITAVFSPFGQLLVTPIAQARVQQTTLAACISLGGTVTNNTGGTLVTCNIPDDVDPTKAVQTDPGTRSASTNQGDALACNLNNVSVCLANVIYAFTVGLGSGLAYVGGFMFDTTVSLSLNSAAYALSFLSSGWTAARDLANMAFILILVYIAFTIMFQAETAGTIRMLAWVIFIALIINFSFFFTRVVIDAGNVLAVQFYNSINAPSLQETMDATSARTGVLANTAAGIVNAASPQGSLANTKDLTYSIMNALNIQALFSNQNFKSFAEQSSFGTKFIILSFLYLTIGACYFILAAMFFAVAVKFIVRVAVLWFLIIASPLAFICKAVYNNPQISAWYDKWQHELVTHAFYPAFFLFIFFFISTIMENFGGTNGILSDMAASLNAAASDPNLNGFIYIASAVANVGIRLGFVIAMLYIALKASDYMGTTGAAVAHRATSFVFGQTGRLVSAPIGFAGRQTFGRAGSALASNKYLATRAAAGSNLLTRNVWGGLNRAAKATGTTLGKTSYDPRNAPGISVLKKGTERITGAPVNAGDPAKGGYMANTKEREDKQKELKERVADIEKREKVKQLAKIEQDWTQSEAELKVLQDNKKNGITLDPPAQQRLSRLEELSKDRENLIKNVRSYDAEKLSLLGTKDIKAVMGHLTDTQRKVIETSSTIDPQTRAVLKTQWHETSKEAPLAKATKELEALGKIHDELAKLGVSLNKIENLGKYSKPTSTVAITEDIAKSIKKEAETLKAESEGAKKDAEKQKEEERVRKTKLEDDLKVLNKVVNNIESTEEEIRRAKNEIEGKQESINDAKIKMATADAESTKLKEVFKGIEEVLKRSESLASNTKEVPGGVGGHKDEGAFTHSV